MTYPNRFSATQQAVLGPILAKLDSLREGEVARLKYPTTYDMKRARYLLHAYFSPRHSGLKDNFRVSTIGQHILLITKLTSPAMPEVLTIIDETEAELLCKKHLAGITDEGEAIRIARTITTEPQLLTDIVIEWQRAYGAKGGNQNV